MQEVVIFNGVQAFGTRNAEILILYYYTPQQEDLNARNYIRKTQRRRCLRRL